MATMTALARKNNPDLPRKSLREAQAVAATARQKVAAIQNAVERAKRLVMDGRRKLEALEKAIAAATAADADQIVEQLVTRGSATPQAAAQRAREEHTAATAALEQVRGAIPRLERDLEDAEHAAERADKDVNAAVAVIMEPVALRLLEEVHSLTVRRLTTQAALVTLGRLWNSWDDIVKRIGRTASINDDYSGVAVATEREWRAALDALRENADAPLPE